MLVVLLAAAAAHATPLRTHIVARGVSCAGAGCAGEPRRSRYRLDPQADDGPDSKQEALATDGGECSVVGARVCTSRPRTLLVAAID